MFYLHESTLWKIHKSFARPLQHIQRHRHMLTVTIRSANGHVCERGAEFPSDGCKQKACHDGSCGFEITLSSGLIYMKEEEKIKDKHVALAPLVSSPPSVMIPRKSRARLVEQRKKNLSTQRQDGAILFDRNQSRRQQGVFAIAEDIEYHVASRLEQPNPTCM